MDLLEDSSRVFMWVSPVPQSLLDRYGLVQRFCKENRRKFRDVLVYQKNYHLSDMDKRFIDYLVQVKRELV